MNLFEPYCKQINELVNNCEDIELLDFIFRMLKQRQERPSPLAVSQE